MLEGKPRESLVLYDTEIEVRSADRHATFLLTLLFARLPQVSIPMTHSRGHLDVSYQNHKTAQFQIALTL